MDKKISQFDVGQYEAEHPQYVAGIRENGIDPDTGDALPIDNVKFPVSEFASSKRADEIEGQVSKGIPAWDSEKTYAKNDSCYYEDENNPYKIYRNISGSSSNNNPAEDTDNWAVASSSSGGATRNIGEIVSSTVPLTDAGLHLLDGALIQGSGIYSEFVDYIASIVSNYPSIFTTESAWQTSVSTYGVCGKFVYDITNNTVRLPKVTGIIEGTTDVNALGNLIEAGLPELPQHTHTYVDYYATFQQGHGGNYPLVSSGNTSTPRTTNNASTVTGGLYGKSSTVQPQTIKVLYYIVVASSTKTDIQIDIDEVVTDLNGKADTDLGNVSNNIDFVIDRQEPTAENNYIWYKLYKSGNVEQGGKVTGSANITVTLPVSMRDKNYTLTVGGGNSSGDWPYGNISSATQIQVGARGTSGFGSYTAFWEVKGKVDL